MVWRSNKHKAILSYIKIAGDEVVTRIYDNVVTMCDEKLDEKINTRAKKAKFIGDNLHLISEQDTLKISNIICETKKSDNIYNIMYSTLLEILNKLLIHMEKDVIDYITDFKEISRLNLISDECKQIVLDNTEKIIEAGFVKNIKQYTGYGNVKYEHIIIIKKMCQKIGHRLVTERINKQTNSERVFIRQFCIKKK